MTENRRKNRRTGRSIRMLRSALFELLKEQPYENIKISEIAARADLARSTFYSHFGTKDDLLESIVDEVFDQFFRHLYRRDVLNPDKKADIEINIRFFEIWQENAEVINLLKAIDIDCLLTQKFKQYWNEHNQKHFAPNFPEREHALFNYINNFLAYSFVAILRQWSSDDMKYPPEVMGRLLYQITGPPVLDKVFDTFNEEII